MCAASIVCATVSLCGSSKSANSPNTPPGPSTASVASCPASMIAIDPNVTGFKEVDRVTQIAFMKDNVLRRMICLSKEVRHLPYLVERNASKEAVTLQKPDFVWHGGRGSQKAGKDFSKAFERRRPGYSLPTRQDEGGSDQWNSWKESFAIETVHLEADPRVFAGQLCHSLDST